MFIDEPARLAVELPSIWVRINSRIWNSFLEVRMAKSPLLLSLVAEHYSTIISTRISVIRIGLGLTFDFILVFSVFTHTSVREMHEILRQLMAMLKSGGALPSRSRIPITIQQRTLDMI
jgi:hypothetical protein